MGSTRILRFPEESEQAVALLRAGECVAVPTETVYGLAADASNPDAVGRIFAAKQRPESHPLIVHISGEEAMDDWAEDISDDARRLAKAFWPGPLSILLKKRPDIPSAVTGGHDTIVLRCPDNEVFLSLIRQTGMGLAAPSANRYQTLSPVTAMHVMRSLNGRIPAIVDGGQTARGIESTIVDASGERLWLRRPGPISIEEIEQRTGLQVETQAHDTVAVPGNVKKHYQPDTPTRLLSLNAIRDAVKPNSNVGVISFSNELFDLGLDKLKHRHLPDDAPRYASELYAALHDLDVLGVETIYIEKTPSGADWSAVNDRLMRAVAKD